MRKGGYIYIMASKRHGTLYVGVTSDLIRRIFEHKDGLIDGFTKKYSIKTLVYVEMFDDIRDAIAREKAVKAWKREWKINAIEAENPLWRDITSDLI